LAGHPAASRRASVNGLRIAACTATASFT
jgi:hypothetical protein